MNFSFVQEWLKRGNQESNYIFRFFCYYIAFNWLYNSRNERWEYERIKGYVKSKISGWNGYNPNTLLKNAHEWRHSVKSERSGKTKRYIINETDPVIKLFLSIYQVRCNLFHGSKSMGNERDAKLVMDGSIVLQDFLNRVIEDGKENEDYAN